MKSADEIRKMINDYKEMIRCNFSQPEDRHVIDRINAKIYALIWVLDEYE